MIDDWLLRVGSSNINNRSMGLDSECDLAVEVAEDHDRPDVRAAILAVRDALFAEHLGVSVDAFRATLTEVGSMTATFDRLAKPAGRTLKPFEIPELNDVERSLVKTSALDPDAPEKMAANFVKALKLITRPTSQSITSLPKHLKSWIFASRKAA